MKTHTNNFKTNIKNLGRQFNVRVVYGGTTLQNEEINNATLNYNGDILKSVMKMLKLDSNVDIPLNTQITFEFGLLVGNSYEYINYGTFIVDKSEKQENTNSYLLTCYDKMLYSMKPYEDLGVTYPITIRNYINALCTKLGLQFQNASDNFVNYNKEIPNELYLDEQGNSLDYNYRDVLDELAQVTASTICINDSGKLEIRYITNTNDTIDEEFLKNVNVNFGEQYGAINTITFSRSADSDSISKSIPENLPDADKIEIKISDNQILNGNNRDEFIDGILNQLYGLSYYINDFSSTGITYYDLCDRYNITVGENTYSCVTLNDEININNGLVENIFTNMPKTSKTDYSKVDKTDRKVNQTNLIVDKQNGKIDAVVSQVDEIEQELANPTSTKTGEYFDLEDALDESLIDFSLYGDTQQDSTPTPSSPQPIHNVSGDNTIEICGKNLFDKDNANILNMHLVRNTTTSSSSVSNRTLYIPVNPNTTYTISKVSSACFTIGTTATTPTYNMAYEQKQNGSTATSLTITTNATANYLMVWFYNSGADTLTEQQILDSIMIEKGEVETPIYEAYTGNSQLISLGDIELNKISTYQDYIYKDNDRWFLHKEIGKVVLNGSEDWELQSINSYGIANFRININDYIWGKDNYSICDMFSPQTSLIANTQKVGYLLNTSRQLYIRFDSSIASTTATFKNWLSTHNTTLYYVLATPTDTEITDTTLLEQLNRLMTLPLYKNMTHIVLTPNDLQPTMKIEYYRDTSINTNFLPKDEITKYYTKTETNSQIEISNSSIKSDVAEIQTTLDDNGNAINIISNQVQTLQTSTNLQINAINETLENGVEKVTNSLVRIDANGINTSKTGETFNTQITNRTFEVRNSTDANVPALVFVGYDTNENRTVARIPELESRQATIGVHRTEILYEDGEYWTADFYVGGGN